MNGLSWRNPGEVYVHEDLMDNMARIYLFDRSPGFVDANCVTVGSDGEWVFTPMGRSEIPTLLRDGTIKPVLVIPIETFRKLQQAGRASPVSMDALQEHLKDARVVRDRLLTIVETVKEAR